VRGFNPGGNHGSFFRVSTHSTFMVAGGSKSNIHVRSTLRRRTTVSVMCRRCCINREFTHDSLCT
jgi:hypothetical protein